MSRQDDTPPEFRRAPILRSRVPLRQITGHLFPVRVMVGWLAPHFDAYYLAGSHRPHPSPGHLLINERLLDNGRRLRERLPVVDLRDAVTDLPGSYAGYVARLLGDPHVQQKRLDGFEFRLLDLHRLCGLQPLISLPKATSIAAAIDPSDPISIARLALPMPLSRSLMIPSMSSRAPSMRVASVSMAPFATPPSHFHVAKLGDRALLTDGYHRAYAFLSAGVRFVPGFFKIARTYAELALPEGLLPPGLLLSPRPPLLTDFLIDGVAVNLR